MFLKTMSFERKFLLIIIGIKIILVLVVLFLFGEGRLIWADTEHYVGLGRNIFLGNGFSFLNEENFLYKPTTAFMPLYPLLLGFFDLYIPHGFAILSLVQAVAAGFTALFTYRIGAFFLPKKWAVGTAILFVFEPLVSVIHILMMPETFFVLFVLGTSYYLLRAAKEANSYDWYRAAIFYALAVYTKPAALYLLIPIVLFAITTKKGARHILVFISIVVIALTPWIIRNNAVSGQYIVTTNAEKNACKWGMASIFAIKNRVDASNWDTTIHLPEYADAVSRCAGVFSAFRIFIFEYPVEFAKFMTISFVSILTNDGYTVLFEKPADEQIKIHHNYLTPVVFVNDDWKSKIALALQEYSAAERIFIFSGKLFWFLTSVLAFIGAGILLRKPTTRMPGLFLVLFIVYFVFASAFAAGLAAGARYRYQVDAMLLILAGVTMYSFWQMGARRFLNQLPITKIKIIVARVLYRLVRLFTRSNKQIITRDGITFEIDLAEGIDLSLFLFGSFQKHVYKNKFITFTGDETVFDIGANAGFMTLQFARRVPNGTVHAFEPTHYAFSKLQKNIALNPHVQKQILTRKLFLSSRSEINPDITAYASWKVDSGRTVGDHPIHWGSAKDTTGVPSVTLDMYAQKVQLHRLDVIKIDTDGHEWDVLLGGRDVIKKFRPFIIFEVADYVMKDRGISFTNYLSYFREYDYVLYNSKSNIEITQENYNEEIPLLGSIDVVAVPVK